MSKAKRVLYIAPQPFFVERGSPMRVRSTVNALGELGYEVDLLALPFGTDVDIRGVRILRSYAVPGMQEVPIGPSWRKIVLDAFLLVKAFILLRKNRYDVVHGVEEGGIIAAVYNKFSRTPYVFDMHSHMSEQLAHSGFFRGAALRWFTALEKFCMRNASGIVTVGDDNAAKAQEIAGDIPVCPLSDLPLDSQDDVSPLRVEALRQDLQLEGKRVAVYTGNFEPYQGIDLLLRAIKRFLDGASNPSVYRVVLVGGGAGTDGLIEQYRQQAADLGIAEQVVFAGQRKSDDMGAFYSLADVLVSPRTEGTNTPLKIYCYMQAERPIVATKILSHTQVLSDQNSYLGDPTDLGLAGAFSEAFADGPADGSDRSRRVATAYALVQSTYSKEAFRRKLGDLYSAIIGPAQAQEPLTTPGSDRSAAPASAANT